MAKSKRRRRRKLARAITRLVLLIFVLTFVIWVLYLGFGCIMRFAGGDNEKAMLFFYDDVLGQLVSVTRSVTPNPDLPTAVLKALIGGPLPGEHLRTTLNPSTKVLSLMVEGGTAKVNLSKEAQTSVQNVPEKMSVYSIVNTLTSLPGITDVEFLIAGVKPTFFTKSFDVSGNFSALTIETTNVRECYLYFPDLESRYVAVEKSKVKSALDPIEFARLVVMRFIQGPNSGQLSNVFPSNTKVRKVSLSEGLLTVDLSAEALQLNTGASGEEAMMQAFVWTMTEIRGVKKVRILVQGKPVDTIGGHINSSQPFERLSPDLIEGGPGEGTKPILVYLSVDMGDGVYLPSPRLRYIRVDADPIKQTANQLLAGPNEDERDYQIGTCIPAGLAINSIKKEKDYYSVDLSLNTKSIQDASFEQTMIQQIVLSLTEADKTMGVLISLNGEIRESLPYGTKTGSAIYRGP